MDTEYNIHSLCRICLEYLNDSKHDLFYTPGLAKKLVVCTSLTVEPQDGFPNNICGICYGRLNNLHDFHKQCVDSVQRFQELIKTNICSSADKFKEFDFFKCVTRDQDPDANKGNANFDPLLNIKIEDDVFQQLQNDQNEVDVPGMNEGKKTDNEAVENNAEFSSSSSSKSDDYYDEDFFPNERDEEESRKETVIRDLVMRPHLVLECNICQEKFRKQHRYNAHMKYHNDALPHQCENCQKGFRSANGLSLHMEQAHSKKTETHPCPEEGCGKIFSSVRIANCHLKKVHNKKKERQSFVCGQCDKTFRCRMAFKRHRYKHEGKESPHQCNICEKRFSTKKTLKDHLMRHAGIKNFVCPYCAERKTTKRELQDHINIHTKEKTFQCHLCQNVYRNSRNLKTHIRNLHNIKNYVE